MCNKTISHQNTEAYCDGLFSDNDLASKVHVDVQNTNQDIAINDKANQLIRPCDFLDVKTFKNSITTLFKDELANVFDPNKPCSWGLAEIMNATGNLQ